MSIEALRKAAESGQPEAQLQLGIACMTGQGGATPDPERGRGWLDRAAAGGHPAAARFLGLIFLRGMDVVPDMDRAVELLQQAATAGDAEAAWWLASYLGGSRDERQDDVRARRLLESAAGAGHPRAMTHLAYVLDGRTGETASPMQAGALLRAAAAADDPGALLALAEWCEHGHWLPRNPGRARALASRAASLGWEVAGEYTETLGGTWTGNALPGQDEFSDRHAAPLPAPELAVLSWAPRAIVMRRFLTVFECAEMVAGAREHLMPSFIVDQDGSLGTNDIRTSHEVRLRPGLRNLVIDTVERRMADWSHFPIEHGEFPLVLRYEHQQSFEQHFDYFIPERFAMGRGPLEFGGQRIATQLVYLNEGFTGGETRFDNAGIEVRPERGLCLLFHNVQPDHNVDPLTRHTGVAVRQGVKWLLSRWIRELPFDEPALDHPRDRYKSE